MAVGTLVSRGTGFLRTLVLTYAIGTTFLGNAYNNPNTLPNTVYYLMLGGIFTAVVVPLLVRAAQRDPDRGEAYAQRMFTLGALALLVVTVLATALAGPLVNLTAPTIHGPAGSHLAAEHNLMVLWAYFFIPQIFFYGMSSLIGAILNTRGRFAAPMWAPVVNNLVVIIIGGLYVAIFHLGREPWNIPASAVQLLGIGTTLGVIAQTVALFPSLRAAGFRWRPTLGFRSGEVREIGRMAGWMSVYVVTQSAANLVAQILANGASAGANGYSAYSIGWQFFQLPYAIVGISVITALLPRMSEHASARRYSLVRDDFSIGVRLASVLVVPASIYLFVLGGPIAEFLISYGSNTPADARYIGEVFGLFSLGLIPYMLTQLQLRVFYSFQDSRTAAFVGLLTMIASIATALIAFSMLPGAGRGGRAGGRVWDRQRGRGDRRVGPAAAAGGQPGRLGHCPEPDPDAPGHRARPGLRGGRHDRRRARRAQSQRGLRPARDGHRRRRRRAAVRAVLPGAAGGRVRLPDQHDGSEVRRAEQAALAWVTTYEHIHVGTRNPPGGALSPR